MQPENFSMPKVPFWVFLVLAVLLFSAVRVDIMDIDAAQYAEISREMTHNGQYVQIYDRGHNYLDKPPFLFWVSAASMKVFGANNLGYKLPSILFALLALYATYRLGRLLYDEATGRMAALILGTCQGLFLMTNDVRCDTILMAWVITAIWFIQEWVVSKKWHYLLLGSACIGLGMMTKGPIALLTPVFAFAADWLLKRQWKHIFKPSILLALILMVLLLIPMSMGLYQQYDLHPEKWFNGKQSTSGLRFFYWTQSFGRITGESNWNNGADISFLLVNMLWSFLPWIFLLLPALWLNIRGLIKQKFRISPQQEWITTGGFLLSYLSLGSSKYQLPHYIFVVFPLAAIIVAAFIGSLLQHNKYPRLHAVLSKVIITISGLLFLGLLLILTVVFPEYKLWVIAWAVGLALWWWLVSSKGPKGKILWGGAAAMLIINVFLTHIFYYRLLQYQVGTQVGRYIHNNNISANDVMVYRLHDPLNALHFYAQGVIRVFNNTYLPSATGKYVLTSEEGVQRIQKMGYRYEIMKQGDYFKVSELTPDFLGAASRYKATTHYLFIKVK